MSDSSLKVETKFVTMEEMKEIIFKDKVEKYIRYELYRRTIFV